MKYRINAFLDYDATEGSLRLNDDGKSDTQLTITANALLYFIIQHPGIISRDDVMKRVWDDNGLVSSNSNLNQYLSMLRKAFRRYGIDNVIVTVSRGRLELNPELQIELIDDTPLHPAVLAAEPA
ncbi:winged helix-turn-helix domain-containing protein, partial [Serratia rubidaea]